MLYHLGYVSTATSRLSGDDLVSMLRDASARNAANNITGLLLHRENSFFQILEGESEAVLQIFSSIERDPRHHRIEVLFQEPITEREFADWRMGFVELDGVDVKRLPGFTDFLYSEAPPRQLLEELTHTRRLMLLFRTLG